MSLDNSLFDTESTKCLNDLDIVSCERLLSLPLNYVGNKKRVLSFIGNVLQEKNIEFDSVFDAFSGSGIVSMFFAKNGKKVFSNDILTSSAMGIWSILTGNPDLIKEKELEQILFCENKEKGFVSSKYVGKFFTDEEALFLDGLKINISNLFGNTYSPAKNQLKKVLKNRDLSDSPIQNRISATLYLYLIEKAITDICFVGGRYYNGQIIAKMEHRLQHNKNKNKTIISQMRSKIKWMIKISKFFQNNPNAEVYNSDIVNLLDSNLIKADLIYIDPPYGGASSDYSYLYSFLEEYLYDENLEDISHIKSSSKFNCKKTYEETFDNFLCKCCCFKNWLISFNNSSFESIDKICSIIGKYKKDIFIQAIPFSYNYRKDRSNLFYVDDVKSFSSTQDLKVNDNEKEFLILAK